MCDLHDNYMVKVKMKVRTIFYFLVGLCTELSQQILDNSGQHHRPMLIVDSIHSDVHLISLNINRSLISYIKLSKDGEGIINTFEIDILIL